MRRNTDSHLDVTLPMARERFAAAARPTCFVPYGCAAESSDALGVAAGDRIAIPDTDLIEWIKRPTRERDLHVEYEIYKIYKIYKHLQNMNYAI